MTPELSRRGFLQRSATTGAGVVLLGSTQVLLTAPNAAAAPATGAGYGPLVPDPAGRLALPQGFSYAIVTEAGVSRLTTGEPTPSNHDGAGAFNGPGHNNVIVYNHELGGRFSTTPLPVPHGDASLVYDPGAAGGCTIVETDPVGRSLCEFVGVAGTATNCAGGITPWGTWLTCEETEAKAGTGEFTKDHGYVFEVDGKRPERNRDPQPITCLGRYAHEAVAVDPRTRDIYLTEDASNPNGLLYRWEAPSGFAGRSGELRKLPATAGRLGAMRCTDVAGAHVDDLSRATEIGTTYAVTWVDVPDRDARTVSTRRQFGNDQITRSRKFEGAWWGPDGAGGQGAFIVCSYARTESPGTPHEGTVWFYDPRRGTLTLKVRFAGPAQDPGTPGVFDGPDNITVSPYGGLILAEDGEGVQQLIGVTEAGQSYAFAQNTLNDNEFAGPVFSEDKKVLFVSIQTPGIMFAITGPFRRDRSRRG